MSCKRRARCPETGQARRGRDLNPCEPCCPNGFKAAAINRTRPPLRGLGAQFFERRPQPALARLRLFRFLEASRHLLLVGEGDTVPSRRGLSVAREQLRKAGRRFGGPWRSVE